MILAILTLIFLYLKEYSKKKGDFVYALLLSIYIYSFVAIFLVEIMFTSGIAIFDYILFLILLGICYALCDKKSSE